MYEVDKFAYTNDSGKTFQVSLHYDEDAPNPREDIVQFLGSFVMWHRRQNFSDGGQREKFPTIEDFREFTKTTKCIFLPVYMYDHSGQTIKTTPFSCPWDSGLIGYIYVTYEKIKEFLGVSYITKTVISRVKKLLRQEIEELDIWIRGDIFGFVVIDENHKQVDSCWGFYSLDDAKEEAIEVCNNES